MAPPSPIVYVFHGSDTFTRDETVNTLRQRMGPRETADLNTARLDGQQVTLGELGHACQSVPFLSDRRLILVKGLLTRLGKERGEQSFQQGLLELLPHLPETTRLIFIEDEALPDSHPILKQIRGDERGYVRCFETPTPRNLPQWIVERAKKHGGVIEAPAAALLAQIVGPDLWVLDQELGKLVTYAGAESAVTSADIDKLVPYAQQAVIFDFVDALGQRNGRVAAETLQRLVNDGWSPTRIFSMTVRQFRMLIQVKELCQEGKNPDAISSSLGLHSYPTRKLYHQATNFTADQLEQVYRRLLDTDLEIKGGQSTPEIALDLLVARLID